MSAPNSQEPEIWTIVKTPENIAWLERQCNLHRAFNTMLKNDSKSCYQILKEMLDMKDSDK